MSNKRNWNEKRRDRKRKKSEEKKKTKKKRKNRKKKKKLGKIKEEIREIDGASIQNSPGMHSKIKIFNDIFRNIRL